MALFVSAGSAIDEGSRGVSIGSFGSNESTDGLAGSMMGGLVKPRSGGSLGGLGLGKSSGGLAGSSKSTVLSGGLDGSSNSAAS